jgi:hypothetical protein
MADAGGLSGGSSAAVASAGGSPNLLPGLGRVAGAEGAKSTPATMPVSTLALSAPAFNQMPGRPPSMPGIVMPVMAVQPSMSPPVLHMQHAGMPAVGVGNTAVTPGPKCEWAGGQVAGLPFPNGMPLQVGGLQQALSPVVSPGRPPSAPLQRVLPQAMQNAANFASAQPPQ